MTMGEIKQFPIIPRLVAEEDTFSPIAKDNKIIMPKILDRVRDNRIRKVNEESHRRIVATYIDIMKSEADNKMDVGKGIIKSLQEILTTYEVQERRGK